MSLSEWFSPRPTRAAAVAVPPVRFGDGEFTLTRVDGPESFRSDRAHWWAATALANAHRWEPSGTRLATPTPEYQQAAQTDAERRERAINAHVGQWHGAYTPPIGQVIEAGDAHCLAVGIRRGLDRMASIHRDDYGDHVYRFTIDGRLVPNVSSAPHTRSMPASFTPVYAIVYEALQGRRYFADLAAFLEGGAVRLTPSLA